jgi:hypothetical protein
MNHNSATGAPRVPPWRPQDILDPEVRYQMLDYMCDNYKGYTGQQTAKKLHPGMMHAFRDTLVEQVVEMHAIWGDAGPAPRVVDHHEFKMLFDNTEMRLVNEIRARSGKGDALHVHNRTTVPTSQEFNQIVLDAFDLLCARGELSHAQLRQRFSDHAFQAIAYAICGRADDVADFHWCDIAGIVVVNSISAGEGSDERPKSKAVVWKMVQRLFKTSHQSMTPMPLERVFIRHTKPDLCPHLALATSVFMHTHVYNKEEPTVGGNFNSIPFIPNRDGKATSTASFRRGAARQQQATLGRVHVKKGHVARKVGAHRLQEGGVSKQDTELHGGWDIHTALEVCYLEKYAITALLVASGRATTDSKRFWDPRHEIDVDLSHWVLIMFPWADRFKAGIAARLARAKASKDAEQRLNARRNSARSALKRLETAATAAGGRRGGRAGGSRATAALAAELAEARDRVAAAQGELDDTVAGLADDETTAIAESNFAYKFLDEATRVLVQDAVWLLRHNPGHPVVKALRGRDDFRALAGEFWRRFDSGAIDSLCPWAHERAAAAGRVYDRAIALGASPNSIKGALAVKAAQIRRAGQPVSPMQRGFNWVTRRAADLATSALSFKAQQSAPTWFDAGAGTSASASAAPGAVPAAPQAPSPVQPSPTSRTRLAADLRAVRVAQAENATAIAEAEVDALPANRLRALAAKGAELQIKREVLEEELAGAPGPAPVAATEADPRIEHVLERQAFLERRQARQEQQQQQQQQQPEEEEKRAGECGALAVVGLPTVSSAGSIARAWTMLVQSSAANGHQCLREREHHFQSQAEALRRGKQRATSNDARYRERKQRTTFGEWMKMGGYVDALVECLNAPRKARGQADLTHSQVVARLDAWRVEDGRSAGMGDRGISAYAYVCKPGLAPLFGGLPLTTRGEPARPPAALDKETATRSYVLALQAVRAKRLELVLQLARGQAEWT